MWKKKIIPLLIPNEEKEGWYYLPVKKNNCTTKKNNLKTWCWLLPLDSQPFRKEHKLNSHEKLGKNKDFCEIAMPSERDTLLQFNQYRKQDKMQYIIYDDMESIIKKIDGCVNNPEWAYSLDIQCLQFGHLIT